MRVDVLHTIERVLHRAPNVRDEYDGGSPETLEFLDETHQHTTGSHLIDCYLEGWAEANPIKIIRATAPSYRFNDPLVGRFSRLSLPKYFEHLQNMFAVAGSITHSDLAFVLRGPEDRPPRRGELQFWREAPRIGLTGVSKITPSEDGVIGESVAYDLNLASNMLRHVG